MEGRHPSLPKTITDEQLANWLKANAKERFNDKSKQYYDDEELNIMARKASAKSAESIMLDEIMATVKFAIEKGNPENLVIEIPVTDGKTSIKAEVHGLNVDVAKGYTETPRVIYGIPNDSDRTMEYFSEDGQIIAERTRALSAKEVNDYIGSFLAAATLREAM